MFSDRQAHPTLTHWTGGNVLGLFVHSETQGLTKLSICYPVLSLNVKPEKQKIILITYIDRSVDLSSNEWLCFFSPNLLLRALLLG